jgi:hypothetical protein
MNTEEQIIEYRNKHINILDAANYTILKKIFIVDTLPTVLEKEFNIWFKDFLNSKINSRERITFWINQKGGFEKALANE